MYLFRNVYKEWLTLYPITDVIKELNHMGNYNLWEENLITLFSTKYRHPLTSMLFYKYTKNRIYRKFRKDILKTYTVGDRHGIANWLKNHDSEWI